MIPSLQRLRLEQKRKPRKSSKPTSQLSYSDKRDSGHVFRDLLLPRENISISAKINRIMETAEYAFAFSIALVFFSCYVFTTIPPKKPPKVNRREVSPSPPPPEIPNVVEPYSEDSVVSSMTRLYKILIDLDVISPDDIVHPPASGHSINLQLCESLHLEPRVISLMKRLPYPAPSSDFEILYETRVPVYTDDIDVKEGRDPYLARTMEDLRLDYLAPTDIALTMGGLYGKHLVLDTKESLSLLRSLIHHPPDPTSPRLIVARHDQDDDHVVPK